jgi:hypothetical protein
VFAAVALQPPPAECLDLQYAGTLNLQAGRLPITEDLQPLNGQNLQAIRRIARLSIRGYSGTFDIAFSPDDSMLAISGVGYPREMVTGTFLWKLKRAPLCVLEVGDTSGYESYKNFFAAFSPDNRTVLLHKCAYNRGIPGPNCYSLRDTSDNHLIARFYDAAFIQQGDEMRFTYQRDANAPRETDGQGWPAVESVPVPIRVIIEQDEVRLIEPQTGSRFVIPVTGEVRDTAFSHDGKLLALAIMQRSPYAPYFWDTYVELWGLPAGESS